MFSWCEPFGSTPMHPAAHAHMYVLQESPQATSFSSSQHHNLLLHSLWCTSFLIVVHYLNQTLVWFILLFILFCRPTACSTQLVASQMVVHHLCFTTTLVVVFQNNATMQQAAHLLHYCITTVRLCAQLHKRWYTSCGIAALA